MPTQLKERAIAVIVNNRPDVLARIAGTFSARGFNIESISANITRNPAVTKIIITTLTTQDTIAKVIKQLNRLVDVLEAKRLRRPDAVRREMIIARVPRTGGATGGDPGTCRDPRRKSGQRRIRRRYPGIYRG